MKSAINRQPPTGAERTRARAGFTLAEVLAALAFMAIVIPVAISGVRLASLAGQVGVRKGIASRIADRVLNDWIVQAQSQGGPSSNLRGSVQEGTQEYRWSIRLEPWNQDTMRLATAEVIYTLQGRDYDVHVSTLVDNSTQ